MIRFFFRFFGLLCLATAFILVVYDGTKSIAANNVYFTSVETLWQLVNARGLAHKFHALPNCARYPGESTRE